MYKKLWILLAAMSVIGLTACSQTSSPDITNIQSKVEETKVIRGSIEMNSCNSELTTAKYKKSDNAADFTSLTIDAKSGDCIVFDNVEFTGAKCLVLEAAISENSTNKAIDLYADEITDANKIGTLITNSVAKVNDLDFNEQYADLTKDITGVHRLIFSFTEATQLEADWFKLTSYTGSETEEERDERMKWWRDAKFGQFIHFGAYSYLGGEYLGEKAGWYSEWIMNSLKISKEDYAKNATALFNPKNFDAKKIVADAKAAGQKYIIITSRHHEGLSIFDTKIRNFKDYCLLNRDTCPKYKGGDILKELSEECKKQGLHFGVYITIMDWHDPSQEGCNDSYIADGYTKQEYKAQLKGQLKELIEDYNVEVFFFDGEWVSWWTHEDGRELYRYILSLNESCIVNNRVGKRSPTDGDYGTPEQEIPVTGLSYDWESNVTMNDSWGYKKGDNNWKSSQWIVSSVMDIVSKGGNLLLNVGPDGDGVVEETPIANMAAAGKWFEAFGEAVYSTQKSCYSKLLDKDIKVTTKPEKGKIYVTLLQTAYQNKEIIILPALENEVLSVKELANGKDVTYECFDGGLLLQISNTEKQKYATVYEVTVEGEPKEKSLENVQLADNLAKGRKVTVSSSYEGKGGDKITDGDAVVSNDNRWAPLDSDNSPWAIIDLGDEKDVAEIVICEWLDTFFTKDYRVKKFKLAVSSDNVNWSEVYVGGSIGERLTVNLGDTVKCRYIKFYGIEKVSGAAGTPSFHEIEVYEMHQLKPEIAFEDMPEKIDSLPYTVKGRYSDGDSVSLKVWSASFAAFEIKAEINEDDGTWQAVLDKDMLQEGKLTLTAILSDESGTQVAASVCIVEY